MTGGATRRQVAEPLTATLRWRFSVRIQIWKSVGWCGFMAGLGEFLNLVGVLEFQPMRLGCLTHEATGDGTGGADHDPMGHDGVGMDG